MPDWMIRSTDDDICVECIICGRYVELTENEKFSLLGGVVPPKVCQRCKDAVELAAKKMPLISGREYNKNRK